MKTILITGSSGFIGQKLVRCRFDDYKIINLSKQTIPRLKKNTINVRGDITDKLFVESLCNKYKPDFVIHCAGIAHQKVGKVSFDEYLKVNSHATEELAKAAIAANPEANFIFLSSVSVYGENSLKCPVQENHEYNPSSDYAYSKLDAERKLIKLFYEEHIKRIDILRLAPVYDSNWSMNLDRRVFGLGKLCYIKFGSGNQKMSAVSRSNLADFIRFLINSSHNFGDKYCNIYNVCDAKPYSFKEIITTFKRSNYQPNRIVITVPLFFVWILTRIVGRFFAHRRWIHSCYYKVAKDITFSNRKMLDTGFNPSDTLTSIFK